MTSRHDRALVALRAAEVAAGLRAPDGQSAGSAGTAAASVEPSTLGPAGDRSPAARPQARNADLDSVDLENADLDNADLDNSERPAQEVTESVARAIALRQLAMAPRSRAELLAKLRLKGCPDALAERVLDRLTEVGLIDDRAFAQMLTHAKHEGSGLARMGLRHQLRKKGIDKELVEDALASITPEAEHARAYELAERKLRAMAGLDPQVQARRLAGMLARKGYPSSVVYPVVRDAVNAAPEHHRD